jgi:hypothetical protein
LKTAYWTLIVALALCAVGGSLAPTHALAKTTKMAASAKASKRTVFVCTECKEYFSPSAAKKMGYKDSMGHKLVKKHGIPAGFTNGSKMKGGKM